MRSGWVLDFNRVRLQPGVGPRPVPGKGSGIFYHTSKPGKPWAPTAGCTQVGNPRQMRWLLRWLRPEAQPARRAGPLSRRSERPAAGRCAR